MKTIFTSALILSFLIHFTLYSQSEKVANYLQMVALGKIDQVKSELPDLLAEYPDDPGVMLLHASVIEDASRAVDIYKKIVKNYPNSEWADDALWRIIQYCAISGDIEQAKTELRHFRDNYPSSPFLAPSNDIVRTALGINKSKNTDRPKLSVNDKKVSDKTDSETSTKLKTSKKDSPVKEEKTKIESSDNEDSESDGIEPNNLNNKNTQKVSEKITPEKHADDKEEVAAEPTGFGLQVGIYKSRESAESERDKYTKMRFRTEILEKKIGIEKMYAVIVGHYSSKAYANTARLNVKQHCDCDPIITLLP
ncbi:MAG: SPOR domain-containing protein [Candidatus Kapabacteria bacterium]|nr:SPOR domain-containing protein [Candidatus Kapabacteria bacterium]